MKKHILSKFSNEYNYQKQPVNYYDEITQLSYEDKQFTKRIVDIYDPTGITETIENSDPDEFQFKKSYQYRQCINGESIETRVIEDSDPDEFVC